MKTKSFLAIGLSSLIATSLQAAPLEGSASSVPVSVALVKTAPTLSLKSLSTVAGVKGKLVVQTKTEAGKKSATSALTETSRFASSKSDEKIGNAELVRALLYVTGKDPSEKGWSLVAAPTVTVDTLASDTLLDSTDPETTPYGKGVLSYSLSLVNGGSEDDAIEVGTFTVGSALTFSGVSVDSETTVATVAASTTGTASYLNAASVVLAPSLTTKLDDIVTDSTSADYRSYLANSKSVVQSLSVSGAFSGNSSLQSFAPDTAAPKLKNSVVGVPGAGKLSVALSGPAGVNDARVSGTISFGASKLLVK
jgi:hypothetical protein